MTRTSIISLLVFIAGCGSGEQHTQLDSANERIRDLEKLIAERDSQIGSLKQELEASSANRTAAEAKLAEKHNADVLALKEFHARQLADLEGKNADLQMQLGLSEKQRLALQGLLDQPDRLQAIRTANNSIERVIRFTLCLACLGVAGFVGTRYFSLRSKRRDDLVRVIAKLGHQL